MVKTLLASAAVSALAASVLLAPAAVAAAPAAGSVPVRATGPAVSLPETAAGVGRRPKRVPGRTLILKVKGAPKGAAARVGLKSPKKYHKTVLVRRVKQVRRLRPGTYRITTKPAASALGTVTRRLHGPA